MYVSGDVLCEEMLSAEEGVLLVGGSGASLDAPIPRLEVPATNPALHIDTEVTISAEAPLGKDDLLHFHQTQMLDQLRVIKGPFQES
jgi:hypothetical protein